MGRPRRRLAVLGVALGGSTTASAAAAEERTSRRKVFPSRDAVERASRRKRRLLSAPSAEPRHELQPSDEQRRRLQAAELTSSQLTDCLADLTRADVNDDGRVDRNEFLRFLSLNSERYGSSWGYAGGQVSLTQMPLEFSMLFYSTACLCAWDDHTNGNDLNSGGDFGCCEGANARIEVYGEEGAAYGGIFDMTKGQIGYARLFCSEALGAYGASFSPTRSPDGTPDASMPTGSPEAGATAPPTPAVTGTPAPVVPLASDGPTASPSAAVVAPEPTTSPTGSPVAATLDPTASPVVTPTTMAPTASPSSALTTNPTASPTVSPAATVIAVLAVPIRYGISSNCGMSAYDVLTGNKGNTIAEGLIVATEAVVVDVLNFTFPRDEAADAGGGVVMDAAPGGGPVDGDAGGGTQDGGDGQVVGEDPMDGVVIDVVPGGGGPMGDPTMGDQEMDGEQVIDLADGDGQMGVMIDANPINATNATGATESPPDGDGNGGADAILAGIVGGGGGPIGRDGGHAQGIRVRVDGPLRSPYAHGGSPNKDGGRRLVHLAGRDGDEGPKSLHRVHHLHVRRHRSEFLPSRSNGRRYLVYYDPADPIVIDDVEDVQDQSCPFGINCMRVSSTVRVVLEDGDDPAEVEGVIRNGVSASFNDASFFEAIPDDTVFCPPTPEPTLAPIAASTPRPTPAPTTTAPFEVPTTPVPIEVPTTQAPVEVTATPAPVAVPTTPAPVVPTPSPMAVPITPAPMEAPVTPVPADMPATPTPVDGGGSGGTDLVSVEVKYDISNDCGQTADMVMNPTNGNNLTEGLVAATTAVTIDVLNSTFPRAEGMRRVRRREPTRRGRRGRRRAEDRERGVRERQRGLARLDGPPSPFSTHVESHRPRHRNLVYHTEDYPVLVDRILDIESGCDPQPPTYLPRNCLLVVSTIRVVLEEGDDRTAVLESINEGVKASFEDGSFYASIPPDTVICGT